MPDSFQTKFIYKNVLNYKTPFYKLAKIAVSGKTRILVPVTNHLSVGKPYSFMGLTVTVLK